MSKMFVRIKTPIQLQLNVSGGPSFEHHCHKCIRLFAGYTSRTKNYAPLYVYADTSPCFLNAVDAHARSSSIGRNINFAGINCRFS